MPGRNAGGDRKLLGELRLVERKDRYFRSSRRAVPDVLCGEKDFEGQCIQEVPRGEQS
jgi:hypothetical protein